MAGNIKYRVDAEALQFRSILLAFGLVDQWMVAVREPATVGPAPDWSAETAREWDRKYQWPEDSRRGSETKVLRIEERSK